MDLIPSVKSVPSVVAGLGGWSLNREVREEIRRVTEAVDGAETRKNACYTTEDRWSQACPPKAG